MRLDSLIFGVVGVCFGLLVGWIIGTQYAASVSAPPAAVAASPQAAAPGAGGAGASGQGAQQQPSNAAVPVDEAKLQQLMQQAQGNAKDARTRAQIGNMYFDAERYREAITWYEESLRIDPNDANISTDLGVSYYYTNQTDRALAQFDKSLQVDPKHTKTMLNIGMVKAFGKQDLAGATEAWTRVVQLAPDTPEGRTARQALESVKAAHPDVAPGAGGAAPAAPNAGAAPPKGTE